MSSQNIMQREHAPRAADVACYLLSKKGSLSGFQLEKLLYYCQAWSLVIERRPLFEEEVRAYENGPVIPSVSMQHKGKRMVRLEHIEGSLDALSSEETALIDAILDAYGNLSGDDLVKLSHDEDPWQECWNGCMGQAAAIIPQQRMQSYYAGLLIRSEEEQASHCVPAFDHPKNIYISDSDFEWLITYLDEE